MRRGSVRIAIVFALALAVGLLNRSAQAQTPMEFIRVSNDGWNFETAQTHQRFVPFGGAFIVDYPLPSGDRGDLTILTQPNWDPETIRKVFQGARSANLNMMKVFLTSSETIKDPQTNDTITFAPMTPPLLERLDQLFQIARENQIYINLTLAEWGMWANRWFQDGGIFFGRHPEDGPGIDSFAVHRNFWKAIAARYKDEPALFSYNLAVEYYIPAGNWWAHKIDPLEPDPNKYWYLFNDTWGLPNWHRWLLAEYGSLAAVNATWGTSYATINAIPQPEIVWDGLPAYTMPQAMIADFNSFKEWTTYRFLRNQADAIRSVDGNHMITAGLHPHHPVIVWAAAAYLLAATPPEFDFLDFTSLHAYTDNSYADGIHNAILAARFAHHPGKPIIVDEIGHMEPEMQDSLDGTIEIINALAGHVSGFQLWVLGQIYGEWGPLGTDYKLNAWGTEWKKLAEPGGAVANLPTTRIPAETIFHLERLNGMAPVQQTEYINVLWNWNGYQHPVDFDLPLNPSINKIRANTTLRDEVWVNFAWSGTQLGTQLMPYRTVAGAVNGVSPEGTILLTGGSSAEKLRITKPLYMVGFDGNTRIGQAGAAPASIKD